VSQKTLATCTVAEAYLQLLSDRGIDYLFANAGTDFAPLIEAYAKLQGEGVQVPTPVTVPHENVAVHMATGYFLGSGRMQAAMVHVNVGTGNSVCGLLNAWRGNIPVLFSAGRTPFSEEGGLLGARTGEIHWPQEMRDQGAMTREFTKWDYELPNAEVLEATVDRAITMATAEPAGPVYLRLPREVLARAADGFSYSSPTRRHVPSPAYPNPAAIERAADMLAQAENPMIVTASSGRTAAEVAAMGRLASAGVIPVYQRKPRYVALETDHAMHFGYTPEDRLQQADVIVVVESDVPWIPNKKSPKPDCQVIQISMDPMYSAYPLRGFPGDVSIAGSTAASLNALADALEERAGKAAGRLDARRRRLGEERGLQREKWAAAVGKGRGETPMHPAWITHCIEQVRGRDGILIKESPVAFEQMNFSQAGTMFSVGAAGALGWGLGTALGVKMAQPGRTVIATCGDGAYMFGNPIPAHYVAKAEKLPILTVVFNNEMWGAVKRNTHEVYPTGHAARSNREPLTYFEPGISRFEKAVEVADGYGERVADPAELPKALDRAMKAIADGRQALLNVICKGP
jgi:acetolactate synthase-1/2/3 large subunit